jgi:hypothetical protein
MSVPLSTCASLSAQLDIIDHKIEKILHLLTDRGSSVVEESVWVARESIGGEAPPAMAKPPTTPRETKANQDDGQGKEKQ